MEQELQTWTEIEQDMYNKPLLEALEIFDDAKCMGYEFLVQGTHIYYRVATL